MCRQFSFIIILAILKCSSTFAQQSSAQTEIIVHYKNLYPEGIAYHAATERIFLSSVSLRKIITVDNNGKAADFIAEGEYGFETGLGMKTDKHKNHLWALSSGKNKKTAALYQFDIESKMMINKYVFTADKKIFFNDLCFDNNQNIYITDSDNMDLYKLDKESGKLELFFKDEIIRYPNGICFDPVNNNLIIASGDEGLVKLSLDDKKASIIGMPNGQSVGLDGIYYHQQTIIGIFNGSDDLSKHKVLRFYLNEAGNRIIYTDTVSSDDMNIPTTGVLDGERFYYLSKTYLADFINNKNKNTMTNEIKILALDSKNCNQVANRIRIIKAVTEAFNKGEWDKIFSYYSDDAIYIDEPKDHAPVYLTKNEVRIKYIDFRNNYPDLQDSIIGINFQNNEATVDMYITGTSEKTGESFKNRARIVLTFNEQDIIIKDRTIF